MLETTTQTRTGKLTLWLDGKEKKATLEGIFKNRSFRKKKVDGTWAIDCGEVEYKGKKTNACVRLNDDIKGFLEKAEKEIEQLKEKERQEEVVFEVIKTMNSGWTPNWNVLEQEEKLLSEKQYKQIQELRNILGERQLFAGAGKFIDAEELPVEEGEKYTLTEIIQLAKEHSNKWQKVKKTEKEEEEHYHKCLEDAKRIGEKVELNRYTTHCNDPQKECSTDIVTVYITPEGKEVSERIHTH